ncbi:MAG: M28 family peptidase, partial [bacterium]|nr:M28 family peptidase [bacterium]
IRFCLYDLEEVGLLGSREHVKLLQDKADFLARDEIFDGAIVLETIGYAVAEKDTQHSPIRIPLIADPPRTGNFILVVGNFKSAHLGRDFEWAARTYADNLPYYSLNCLGGFFKDAARSDHSSYWQAGLPAVMITDTANFRNPHYHRTSDTPETLNFTFLSRVVQATVGTLLNYAQPVDNDG